MKIGKFWFGIDRTKPSNPHTYDSVNQEYELGIQNGKQLILGTLVARSGTRWLGDIFAAHNNATGVTERDVIPEAFYRYITYNKLPIDTAGIITLIKRGIIEDWKHADIAFVNSPYFSHGVRELCTALRPSRLVFGINDPKFTVQSIYNKGLFGESYIRGSNELALGFQPTLKDEWSHFFGRVVPNGSEYKRWLTLTRIGKISWWGNRITEDIYNQLKVFPEDDIFVFHLKEADQNYEYYKKFSSTFGLTPTLDKKKFLAIKGKTVKNAQNAEHVWSVQEKEEFKRETKEWHVIYRELCR